MGHPVDKSYIVVRSFRVTHYVILNVILYAFYKLNYGKLTFFLISFAKHIIMAFKMT